MYQNNQQQYNKLFLFLWNIANDTLVKCIRKERQQEDNTALHNVAPVPLDDYDYQRDSRYLMWISI